MTLIYRVLSTRSGPELARLGFRDTIPKALSGPKCNLPIRDPDPDGPEQARLGFGFRDPDRVTLNPRGFQHPEASRFGILKTRNPIFFRHRYATACNAVVAHPSCCLTPPFALLQLHITFPPPSSLLHTSPRSTLVSKNCVFPLSQRFYQWLTLRNLQ